MTQITRIVGVTLIASIALVALVNCQPATFLGTSGSGQPSNGTNETTAPQFGSAPGQSPNITATVPGGNAVNGSPPGGSEASGNKPGEQPPASGSDAAGQIDSTDSTPNPIIKSDASGISPANGSKVCLQPAISVNLGLTDAMRKDGALDITKIKLVLDGMDVTAKITALGTMDYPQSHATITYVPDAPLAAGKHTASVTMATPTGDQTYQWTFETADISCQ